MRKPCTNHRLLFDIGSTYFKVCEAGHIEHYFRNFRIPIHDDLRAKCGEKIARYAPEDIAICSSANGGLSTLIVGISRAFSLTYATNIAYNSGINIIDTVLYRDIERASVPTGTIDVVILAGGIDDVAEVFDARLMTFLEQFSYQNIVHVGSARVAEALRTQLPDLVVLPNILDRKLKMHEAPLRRYLTDLYQADIVGKEEIKELYAITANQIYPTPYIVNRALPRIAEDYDLVDPFVLIDIGGATTDIHYSRDLVNDRLVTEGGYDRLVFKKLGVYKSRESLVYTARHNEYVYELLGHLGATESILDEQSDTATRILMLLAIFLVLYKVSRHHADYVELKLEHLNALVFTGGIAKVLTPEEVERVVSFFYNKLLRFHRIPRVVLDGPYAIWTYGHASTQEASDTPRTAATSSQELP
jgi:hypothetical protein